MRIGNRPRQDLDPEDVAWIVEWQLASGIGWLPIGEESLVLEVVPVPQEDVWIVAIRAGAAEVRARLPAKELERLARWCHQAPDFAALLRPPPAVRVSMLCIQRALRAALRELDPLGRMGYRGATALPPGPGEPSGRDSGSR